MHAYSFFEPRLKTAISWESAHIVTHRLQIEMGISETGTGRIVQSGLKQGLFVGDW